MRYVMLIVALATVGVGSWAIANFPPEHTLGIVAIMVSVLGVLATLHFRAEALKTAREAQWVRSDRERKQAAFDVNSKMFPHDLQKLDHILVLCGQHNSPIPIKVFDDNPDHAKAATAFLNALSHVAVQIFCHHIDEATVFLAYHGSVIEAVDALKPFIDSLPEGKAAPATQLAEAWRAKKSLRTGEAMTVRSDLGRVIPSLVLPKPRPR